MMAVTAHKEESRARRAVFTAFALFFASFIIVDIVFVTMALRTHTGVVTENAYEKGLAYNRVIDAAEAQKKAGWQGAAEVKDQKFFFSLRAPSGQAIKSARVRVVLSRPLADHPDVRLDLSETPRGYEAPLPPLARGLWRAHIRSDWAHGTFQQTHEWRGP